MLHKSDDGLSYNTYLLSGLTAGETYSVLFISKVYVNEDVVVADDNGDLVYVGGEFVAYDPVQHTGMQRYSVAQELSDEVTVKEYLMTVHVDKTDAGAVTDVSEGTLIEVRDMVGNAYDMDPNFNTDFNYYYVQIPYSQVSVDVFVDASYTVIKDGVVVETGFHDVTVNNRTLLDDQTREVNDLQVGDNIIKVEIKNTSSEGAGKSKYYTIVVNRLGPETEEENWPKPLIEETEVIGITNKDGVTEQKNLTLTPMFSVYDRFYFLIVKNEVEKVDVSALARNASVLRINGVVLGTSNSWTDNTLSGSYSGSYYDNYAGTTTEPMYITLTEGRENVVEIEAFGMDGDGNTTGTKDRVVISITRLPENYQPVPLQQLTVSEGTISSAFESDQKQYYVTVPWDVTSLDITAFASDKEEIKSSAKIIAPNSNVVPEETVVRLHVTDLPVGRTNYEIFVHDERENGVSYYQDIYSLIINRLPRTGISLDLTELTVVDPRNADQILTMFPEGSVKLTADGVVTKTTTPICPTASHSMT